MTYEEDATDRFLIWRADNRDTLLSDWLNTLPPEEVPLDEDMPDFLDDNEDKFNAYCLTQWVISTEK